MPFTVSHVAAVLPLHAGPASRWALPAAPLVLGSMAPDVVNVLGRPTLRGFTHSLTGAVVVDLPLVALSWLLWVDLLREPVQHLLPGVAARWRPPVAGGPVASLARWLAAAVLGIATHLAWDSVTHDDGWVVTHVQALQARAWLLSVADWLQVASSVLGILVVAWWLVRWWRTTAPRGPVPPPRGVVPVAAVLVVLAVLGAARRAGPVLPELLRTPLDRGTWRAFLSLGLFGAAGGVLVAALLTGLVWRVRPPSRTAAER